MKIINKQENQIIFAAEIEDSIANAIRRYLNQIPVFAVDEVEISKNDSPLYDETIAHRLGLVSLKMEKSLSEKKAYKLKLDAKKEGYVYSGELKGGIKIVYDKIPLTLLHKGQELSLVATVKTGKGKEHSKFSPGLMFYRNKTEITLDKEFYEEVKKICPNNEIKEKGDKIIVIDNLQNEICDVCEGICREKGKRAETKVSDDLIITLESFGQLDVKDIVKATIDALKKDLTLVSKAISKA
ncbi:DNA-directed RNA polymerase subunit D [Nanoarchaeota archaeon]